MDRSVDSARSLTFTDLAGVFYMVAFAVAAGFIVLAIEWLLSSFTDVTSRKSNAPRTLKEALRRRKNKLLHDIRWEWFPIEKYINKWKKLRLPTDGAAEEVLMKHFAFTRRKPRHARKKTLSRSLSTLRSIPSSPDSSYTTVLSRISSMVKADVSEKRRSTRSSARKSILRRSRRSHSKRVSFRNSNMAEPRQARKTTEASSDWERHVRF